MAFIVVKVPCGEAREQPGIIRGQPSFARLSLIINAKAAAVRPFRPGLSTGTRYMMKIPVYFRQ